MKQLAFMIGMLTIGSLGSLYHPFWALMLYYGFAVLRPQYLWDWSLPQGVRWSLFAAVIVMISCVINFSKLVERRRFNAVLGLMLVYALLLLASILTAYDPAIAMQWGREYGKIFFIAVIASLVVRHLWQIRLLTIMILLTLGYIAWEINYLYLVNGRLDIFHRGFGGLDNNGAGLMVAMGVPIAFAFGVSAKEHWQRGLAWFAAALMVHVVLMSYSRGAMLGLVVAAVWILLNHRPRRHAMIIALVACLAVSVMAGKEIRERFLSISQYQADISANSRFESWAAGWAIAKEHPLLGQGIRNSNIYTSNYGADRVGRTIHSQYLQIAADCGLPALMVYVTMVLVALWYLRRSRIMCTDYVEQFMHDHPHGNPDPQTQQFVHLALGIEASLFVFAFDGIFLSLEVFELPWLMIVLAGVLPSAVEDHLAILTVRKQEKKLGHAPSRKRRQPRSTRPLHGPAATNELVTP